MPDVNSFTESEPFVKKSEIGFISSQRLPEIIREFNQLDNSRAQRPSILKNINFFGLSLFTHRILAKDEVRLVQRNGAPELAGYTGKQQRRKKIWSLWKPWTWFRMFRDDSSTIGIYKISDINRQGYIGYGDRHLVSVNQGEYAKVIIDGEPILLDEGAHIIKTNNFSYAGKVKQSESFIKHENLYRLQVPSAKIAAFLKDNQPYLIDAGTHYICSNNFNLVKPQTENPNQLFHNSADPVIQCGSLLRLMPKANTVAVYYQNGEQKIFPDDNEKSDTRKKVDVINDPTVKLAGFLPTNLVTKHYPNEAASAQFIYYTQDSVRVGVKLFVTYCISDPKLALQNLDLSAIDKLIEDVTHCDMGIAAKKNSLQSTDDLKVNRGEDNTVSSSDLPVNPPAYNQIFASNCWQDAVKDELTKDLKSYGIELIRLNIDEIKILDPEVEKKMSEQSYRVAEANANLAAAGMVRQVEERKALTAAKVAQVNAEQEAQNRLLSARTQKEVSTIEAETQVTTAKAEANALKQVADVFKENPAALQWKLAEIQAKALKPTDKVISVGRGDNSSLFGLIAGSGLFNLAPNILPTPTQQIPSPQPSHSV